MIGGRYLWASELPGIRLYVQRSTAGLRAVVVVAVVAVAAAVAAVVAVLTKT